MPKRYHVATKSTHLYSQSSPIKTIFSLNLIKNQLENLQLIMEFNKCSPFELNRFSPRQATRIFRVRTLMSRSISLSGSPLEMSPRHLMALITSWRPSYMKWKYITAEKSFVKENQTDSLK